MQDKQLLSPRDVAKELHVTNRTLQRWATVGWLTPSHFTAGGHARYDRALIEAAKRGERREPVRTRRGDQTASRYAGTETVGIAVVNETRREVGLVLSAEIERTKREATAGALAQRRLANLYDEAVRVLLGIERGALCSQLWRHQLAKVADALGVSSSRLRDICDLYEIPTPPPGYWLTRPERRSVRILDQDPNQ
ncbi:MerR family transcriptional regulator [Tardiphaga sp. P9-11]|uniref:MerR family transcriptional regulator n=1 Tax=Tardiphaga sp. P9-11 TaxID=2024614 RepID=UPI0018D9E575|nr:MerR family transcriptional regulator [Tardiphaga sp. P9-11]